MQERCVYVYSIYSYFNWPSCPQTTHVQQRKQMPMGPGKNVWKKGLFVYGSFAYDGISTILHVQKCNTFMKAFSQGGGLSTQVLPPKATMLGLAFIH